MQHLAVMLSVVILFVIMLNVINAECHYVECRFAECRGAQGMQTWVEKLRKNDSNKFGASAFLQLLPF
jgi:hypothetical protein